MTICKTNTDIYATGEGRSALTHVRLLARGSFRGRCASKVLVAISLSIYICPHIQAHLPLKYRRICLKGIRGYLSLSIYMCVSANYYKCVCILLHLCFFRGRCASKVLVALYMCPHTTINVSAYYMCPHTTIYVSAYCYMCPHTTTYVLILLYMCPHTTVCVLIRLCVSSYYYRCVRILLYVSSCYYVCPHTAIYVSSY